MQHNSGNILFVGNNEQELNYFRSTFIQLYNVFTAKTSREAHEILADYDINLVIVSQQMSDMTGLQFCESIRPDYPSVQRIVITDSNLTDPLVRAVRSGHIYRYVKTPYDVSELRMTIDGALKLNALETENQELLEKLNHQNSEKEHIMRLFKRYVPKQVVDEAMDTEEEDTLPAETRIVSILFADIRNFTRIANRLKPDQVLQFLNDFFAVLTRQVDQHHGSVNKYLGDGILAVFGAPVSYKNNHENAVLCALDILDALDEINTQYGDIIGSEIQIGIGVNTGEVIVGHVGTDEYMEYTVIGDTVNIAKRLESITKLKPNSIIISEETYQLVKDVVYTSEFIEAPIAGKERTITYCEVTGKREESPTARQNIRPLQKRRHG